jgi:hypothetical protein
MVHTAEQGPADDMARAAGVSDEPELDAAIEQLLAEERARGATPQQDSAWMERTPSLSDEGSEERPASAADPGLENTRERTEGRGSGWRGLFSRKDRGLTTSSAADPAQVGPALPSEPDTADATLPNAPASDRAIGHTDPIPRTGDDWFDRALSGLDEVGPARTIPQPTSGDVGQNEDSHRDIAGSRLEIHQRSAEPTSRGAPADSNPAVIGRYTSGNTTYVMYADGSIEAETPTGILRFASLADLKVYVEGGE